MALEKLHIVVRVDHDEKMKDCVSLLAYGSKAEVDQAIGESKVQDLDGMDGDYLNETILDALQILKPLGELTNDEVEKVWETAVAAGLNVSYHELDTDLTPNGPPS